MNTSIRWSATIILLILVCTQTGFGQQWQTPAEKAAATAEGKDFQSPPIYRSQALRKSAGTASLGTPLRFDYNVTTPLPDQSTTDIPFNVSGFTGELGKVTVSLHLDHTWDGDMEFTLIAPDLTSIDLCSDNGGSGDNFGIGCSPDADRTTFDDDAGVSITIGSAPFVGSFFPEMPLATFNGKSGAAVNGTWTLRIHDDASLDVGTFYCASLVLSPLMGFESVSSTVLAGNFNGVVDPNECNLLNISIKNVEPGMLTGITGTLSTTTAGVVITQATSAYPDAASMAVVSNSTPFGIATTPAFVCGTPIDLTLSLSYDSGSDVLSIPLSSGSAVDYAYTNDVPLPDLSTTDIPISVSGFTGTIDQMTLAFHLTHTWDGDLDIYLISPDNTMVLLSDQNGSGGDDYGESCSVRTVFSDNASVAISAGTPPFAGTFIPDNPLSTFNGKSGAQVNGTWTMRIVDNLGGDQGTFHCATLSLGSICTDGGAGAPAVAVTLSPDKLWPPDHKMDNIEATVDVTGNCGISSIVLDAVTSNEPDNGEDDGDTVDDIQNASTGTHDLFFDLRAERSGIGTGRVYTATYTVTNMLGYSATASGTVIVPLSNSSVAQQGLSSTTEQQELRNYPNPFNPLTQIEFELKERSSVSISIMDIFGREIERLVSGVFETGQHTQAWDASRLTSGTYFARLIASGLVSGQSRIIVKKMTLSK